MKKVLIIFSAIILISATFDNVSGQIVESDADQTVKLNPNQTTGQTSEYFLGIKPKPEVRAMIVEIEKKSGKKIYGEYIEQGEFMLGSSYISADGSPIVLIDYRLENGDQNKLEAIIAHELLHLRLRVNGYPTFEFSESVNMSKGRAIDTEQDHLNDVTSLIEHQIFKADMEKFGLYQYVNLAGDTAAEARKNRGRKDSQADAINYARAILEYPNAKDVEEVRQIYTANKWTRSLREGKAIADIISTSNIRAPKDVEAVYLKCLLQLYPLPGSAYNFKLTVAPNKKVERLIIVSVARRAAVKGKSRKH